MYGGRAGYWRGGGIPPDMGGIGELIPPFIIEGGGDRIPLGIDPSGDAIGTR